MIYYEQDIDGDEGKFRILGGVVTYSHITPLQMETLTFRFLGLVFLA